MALLTRVFDEALEGILLVDVSGKVVYANYFASKLLEYKIEDITGKDFEILFDGVEEGDVNVINLHDFEQCFTKKQSIYKKVALLTGNGSHKVFEIKIAPLILEKVPFCVVFLKEFIPTYVQPEKIRELARTAMLDYLTGIGNRMYLEERLKETIFEREVFGIESCVVFMDLDNFKEINDKFGHDAGDMLLKEFARFLLTSFMSHDYIGRWGGDEFIVILNAVTLQDVPKVLDRFYKHLSKVKVNVNGDEIFIQASAGVTSVNIGDSIETILSRCDKALYKAKRMGKNQYFIIF